MKSAILLHGLVGTLQDKNEKHKLINSNVDYDTKKDSNVVLKKGWESYSKNFDNCDYYVHSWNTELEKEITELYKPIKYKLEEQIKFQAPQEHKGSDLRWINHMGRFYSMKQSIEMCLSKNIKYDYIMISRFDLVFRNKFRFLDRECLVSEWYDGIKVDSKHKVNDFWFVLNYESLIKFYKELNNIEEYMLSSQTNIGVSPHYALSRIFTKLNFKIKENLKYYNDKKQYSDYGLVREPLLKKVMIDVGTNFIIGIHNNYEEVHCIEPIPEICNWLKNNTNYNIHEFAVDNFIGQREFGISKIVDGHQKMGCSSLYEFTDDKNGWTKMRDDFQFDKKINVNVITMENFIQNNDIKNIEYFQCDAQGSDLNVLKSFGKYINIIEEGRIEVANSVELYKGVDNTFPSAKKFLEENNFKITNWDMIEKWEDKPEIDVEFKRK